MKRRAKIDPRYTAIGRAVFLQEVERHLRTVAINVYMQQQGEPSHELLAHLGWMFAVGAEIAHHFDPPLPPARSLHAELRSVVAMCAEGGRWCTAVAPRWHAAAIAAKDLLAAHPTVGQEYLEGADALAVCIRAGTATLADLAALTQ